MGLRIHERSVSLEPTRLSLDAYPWELLDVVLDVERRSAHYAILGVNGAGPLVGGQVIVTVQVSMGSSREG